MEIRKGSRFSLAPQPTGHDASLRASQEPVFAEGATQWRIRQPFMTVVGPAPTTQMALASALPSWRRGHLEGTPSRKPSLTGPFSAWALHCQSHPSRVPAPQNLGLLLPVSGTAAGVRQDWL